MNIHILFESRLSIQTLNDIHQTMKTAGAEWMQIKQEDYKTEIYYKSVHEIDPQKMDEIIQKIRPDKIECN